jgi:hypothetical protein
MPPFFIPWYCILKGYDQRIKVEEPAFKSVLPKSAETGARIVLSVSDNYFCRHPQLDCGVTQSKADRIKV